MAWYREGTVQVTNGSNAVIGAGTKFIANTRVGDAFKGPDGAWYEVINVASDTAMAIAPDYAGPSGAGLSYSVTPVQGYNKLLSDQVSLVISDTSDIVELAQTSAAASANSASAALTSKNAAAGSAAAASDSATASAGSAAAALTSKNAAAGSATAASDSAAAALTSKNAAAGSATAASDSAAAAALSAQKAAQSEQNTSNKINVSDIADDLVTNSSTKVLSAKQGKTLQDAKANKADVAGLPGRNRLINGDCSVYQRANGDISGTLAGYMADRWQAVTVASGGVFTPARDSSTSYQGSPRYWHKVITKTPVTDLSGTKYCVGFATAIEGNDCYDMSGVATCLSFVFSATVAGKYYVSIRNWSTTLSFVQEFIVAANTPTKIEIKVPPLPSGIGAGTSVGIYLAIAAATNGTYACSRAQLGAWQSANYLTGPDSALPGSWVGTANAYLILTDVQYEIGTAATAYDRRSYADELRRCQRYYEEIIGTVTTTAEPYKHIPYKVEKRETPSLLVISGGVAGATYDTQGARKSFRCPAGVLPTANQDFVMAAYSEIL